MQMFEAMNRAIAANGIKPAIDKVFGFDEVQAAYKHMASQFPVEALCYRFGRQHRSGAGGNLPRFRKIQAWPKDLPPCPVAG